MLFAHLKRINAIARAARCPVRVHAGGDCPEPAQVAKLVARPPPLAVPGVA
jgi:hypothetical protein